MIEYKGGREVMLALPGLAGYCRDTRVRRRK
jgi:hypothetical protein